MPRRTNNAARVATREEIDGLFNAIEQPQPEITLDQARINAQTQKDMIILGMEDTLQLLGSINIEQGVSPAQVEILSHFNLKLNALGALISTFAESLGRISWYKCIDEGETS